jgi:F-type H+-transporting ATPase subunit gamma
MAVGKEIRDQIKSVTSTQKITRAMEMVAASKMRKAQGRMENSRPYSNKISSVVAHMAQSHSEYHHPFMQTREVKRVGVILVSSDRGLCGGLNINVFRELLRNLTAWEKENIEIDFAVIGGKGKSFLSRVKANVVAEVVQIGDSPSLNDFIGPIKTMLDLFSEGKIDELYVMHNNFVNSMTQEPNLRQLLPAAVDKKEETSKDLKSYWDYLYEPDAKEVMDKLLMRYIESLVYQGVVENIACEQSSRMVAMKNATDNAGDLIDNLQLVYNKARQTAITAELADIVGGAAAV